MATVDPWTKLSTMLQIEARLVYAVQHAGREIGRGRKALRLMDLAGFGIERQQVRECAADIDGDANVFQKLSLRLLDRDVGPARGRGEIGDFLRQDLAQLGRRGGDRIDPERRPFLLDVWLLQQRR